MNVFNNIRVLELGRVFSGPLCGMVLSDIGAEVIKVERPETGDESRQFGMHSAGGQSCYFNSLNRNKKSLALDLKDPGQKKVLQKLIETSDVLVHNWLQESLDNLGFSYEEAKKINPKLIYCVISGYGYQSSYRNQPSQDIIAQSLSGFMSLTGDADGMPMKTGIPVVDYAAGLYAAYAIMSALYMREKTGEGQLVHTSLLETALAMTSFASSQYLSTGIVPKRTGNRHPSICPYNVYRTKDGLITIAIANQNMWVRFCDTLGLEDLKDHTAFKTNKLRLQNQDALETILEAAIKVYSTDDLITALKRAKVSCTKVNHIEEAFHSPEVRELDIQISCSPNQQVSMVGNPFHLEKLHRRDVAPPPALGESNEEILSKLGF
ncbi:MAG: CoA transferase [Clostridia bacterium]|nr:CoA transferase [Clostridia bacterium]